VNIERVQVEYRLGKEDGKIFSFERVALVLFFIVFFSACDNGPKNTYQGYIEGDYLYVSSPVGGKVLGKYVIKGNRVEKGTLLFELDPEPEQSQYMEAKGQFQAAEALLKDKTKGQRPVELSAREAAVARAEAALVFSKKEFERAVALRDKNAISDERYDEAESAYNRDRAAVAELTERLKAARLGARSDRIEAARKDMERSKATLDQALWKLDQKKGIAPASALVTDVLYQEGEYAPPGYPVAVLLPPDNVKARFFVPEATLSSLEREQKVTVIIDGVDESIKGSIRYISPRAEYTPPFIYSKDNRKKLVFMVEVTFSESDARKLHPGQPVEVRLGS
jgi:HlyD family secretion protein